MDYPEEWKNKVFQKSQQVKHTLPRPPQQSDKLAIIADARNEMFLLHVIRIAIHHLAPKGFAFLFIHGTENAVFAKTWIAPLGVSLQELPLKHMEPKLYSRMLLHRPFWETLKSEHILIYEMDTYIRHGNIEQFLEYDYIGAPREPSLCPWFHKQIAYRKWRIKPSQTKRNDSVFDRTSFGTISA